MPRIVLIDVDGTLVDYHNRLPASAVRAVREARGHGHRVYLCTGRSRAEVYDELWEMGVDGLIGANGGYVEDAGEVVLHQRITAEQNAAIVDWLHERGLEFYLEANSGLYASENFETVAQPTIQRYSARKGAADADTRTVRDVFPEMIFGADLYRDDVNKISYVLNSLQDHLDATEAFPGFTHNTWGGRGAEALFGDIAVEAITKASAVDALLEHLGADRADTVAFGDATVDVPLLQACAVGVAMGDASDDLKAVADLVTDDVEHDGLAHAFERLGLTGPQNEPPPEPAP